MEFLKRTPGSAGNRRTFTLSTWMKRGILSQASGTQNIFEGRPGGGEYLIIGLTNAGNTTGGNTFRIEGSVPSGTAMNLGIDRFFRDASAWYHLVFAFDTTQATASNRAKFYVNGVQTGLNSTYTTYPSQNADFYWNNTQVMAVGGSNYSSGEGFDGYLADTYNIDGLQLTPSSFGETDSTTGIWVPKTYSGAYGTNGFRLEYKNSAALGTDTSGQGNNFTPQNMSADNQVVDTPDNNFVTWNPLVNRSFQYPLTLSEGNLKVIADSNASYGSTMAATMSLGKGKWYWEFKYTTSGTGGYAVGWGENTYNFNYQTDAYPYKSTLGGSSGVFYRADGRKVVNGTETSAGDAWDQNDIIGVAADFDASTITFYNQGVSQFTVTSAFTSTVNYYPEFYGYGSKGGQANFGNPPFTISSGNADANGLGNFEYAVPSGYYALCTKNLNTYG